MLVMEQGFSNPMTFKPYDGTQNNIVEAAEDDAGNDAGNDAVNDAGNDAENDDGNEENIDFRSTNKIIQDGYIFSRNNRKIKKFWSSDTLKDCWKDHLEEVESDNEEEKESFSNENADDSEIEVSPMLFL